MSELWKRGAVELVDLIRSRKFSCREVVEAHLLRVANANADLNAVTVVLEDLVVKVWAPLRELWPIAKCVDAPSKQQAQYRGQTRLSCFPRSRTTTFALRHRLRSRQLLQLTQVFSRQRQLRTSGFSRHTLA
jgi:hypothetical protein